MNTPPVSVVVPVGQAIERVKVVLFRPFDFGRWFVIGFAAWLAELGRRGGGGGMNFRLPTGGRQDVDFHEAMERAREYVLANLHWIVPLAVVILVLAMVLGVLFAWLSSRGQFMFLHCVALNRAEIVVPWNRFRREGNSLFWFRLVLGLINLALVLPVLVVAGTSAYRMFRDDAWNATGILTLVGLGLVFILIAVVFGIVAKLTSDFVVPIMFLRGKPCLAAWRELLPLMTGRLGAFVLYILFQIVLAIAIGMMVILAILITCCIAGCLFALPYLGTVALLPVLVFKRAYSIHYFAQFGSEFDVFPRPEPPPAVAPAAPPPVPPLGNGPAAGI